MPGPKCYVVTLGLLGSGPAGVQGIHAMHELDRIYGQSLHGDHLAQLKARASDSVRFAGDEVYVDWSQNHMTVVLLSSGNYQGLMDVSQLVNSHQCAGIPYAVFYEDQETLNKLQTAVAFVLPEKLADWEPDPVVESIRDEVNIGLKCRQYPVFEGNVELYKLVRLVKSLHLVR